MKQHMVTKDSKLMKYMKAPARLLIQAKDLYVESWTGGAGNVSFSNAMGCPTPHSPVSTLNFSPNSNSSPKYPTSTTPKQGVKQSRPRSKSLALPPTVPRAVLIGTIDEDEPFEYGDEDVGLLKSKVIPRSRSYELSRTQKLV